MSTSDREALAAVDEYVAQWQRYPFSREIAENLRVVADMARRQLGNYPEQWVGVREP